jgi:conjugative transfer pilus assembly protein TraH
MSIVGAVIFPPETANRDPEYRPEHHDRGQLLYGQSDAAGGNINLQLLRCNNYTDCDTVTRDNTYVPAAHQEGVRHHALISDKIRTRTAIPNNSAAVGFVNSTSIPVWRCCRSGTPSRAPACGHDDRQLPRGHRRRLRIHLPEPVRERRISALTKQHR